MSDERPDYWFVRKDKLLFTGIPAKSSNKQPALTGVGCFALDFIYGYAKIVTEFLLSRFDADTKGSEEERGFP